MPVQARAGSREGRHSKKKRAVGFDRSAREKAEARSIERENTGMPARTPSGSSVISRASSSSSKSIVVETQDEESSNAVPVSGVNSPAAPDVAVVVAAAAGMGATSDSATVSMPATPPPPPVSTSAERLVTATPGSDAIKSYNRLLNDALVSTPLPGSVAISDTNDAASRKGMGGGEAGVGGPTTTTSVNNNSSVTDGHEVPELGTVTASVATRRVVSNKVHPAAREAGNADEAASDSLGWIDGSDKDTVVTGPHSPVAPITIEVQARPGSSSTITAITNTTTATIEKGEGDRDAAPPTQASLAVPQAVVPHERVYVPLSLAKARIEQLTVAMATMKSRHVHVVAELHETHETMEAATQEQFLAFIGRLRTDYEDQIGLCKRVIRQHQADLNAARSAWDATESSLRRRHSELLAENKTLLTSASLHLDNLETTKDGQVSAARTSEVAERTRHSQTNLTLDRTNAQLRQASAEVEVGRAAQVRVTALQRQEKRLRRQLKRQAAARRVLLRMVVLEPEVRADAVAAERATTESRLHEARAGLDLALAEVDEWRHRYAEQHNGAQPTDEDMTSPGVVHLVSGAEGAQAQIADCEGALAACEHLQGRPPTYPLDEEPTDATLDELERSIPSRASASYSDLGLPADAPTLKRLNSSGGGGGGSGGGGTYVTSSTYVSGGGGGVGGANAEVLAARVLELEGALHAAEVAADARVAGELRALQSELESTRSHLEEMSASSGVRLTRLEKELRAAQEEGIARTESSQRALLEEHRHRENLAAELASSKRELERLQDALQAERTHVKAMETERLTGLDGDDATKELVAGLQKSVHELQAQLDARQQEVVAGVIALKREQSALEEAKKSRDALQLSLADTKALGLRQLESADKRAEELRQQGAATKEAEAARARDAAQRLERQLAEAKEERAKLEIELAAVQATGGGSRVGQVSVVRERSSGSGVNPAALAQLEAELAATRTQLADAETRAAAAAVGGSGGGAGAGAGGGKVGKAAVVAAAPSLAVQKAEKAAKAAERRVENYKKQDTAQREEIERLQNSIKLVEKEDARLKEALKQAKAEVSKLGVAAGAAAASAEELAALKQRAKQLAKENKTLADNFNQERILRKKYYNQIEDMKGKIRVYARARPLSGSERDRGNFSVLQSPDEYTVIVENAGKRREYAFDRVFMPDNSQDDVYEDTHRLVQSAVDGYNVCIFAYGQTGSGKTYTMIGDGGGGREMTQPGLAPRAFQDIFALAEAQKSKFSFRISCYMIEIYRDNLIDLFGQKRRHSVGDSKLKPRLNKQKMVYIEGAIIKEAATADELYAHFEHGAANRKVATTNMNVESSRSHLIIGVLIESTNLTTGAVVHGKLSLVDLAGSERASKTGATGDQIEEAKSINRSLSALGDVFSALSSQQDFVPYRNNILTLLMQDSLGGNAKTLMFVNISPADYNLEETVISLMYASRVKLITNKAAKNADSKEVARLKDIIKRLKAGDLEASEEGEMDLSIVEV